MLNLVALVFAGLLVAGVAVAVGLSNAGPSVGATALELQKLAPSYWPRVEARMSYNMVQAPTLVGPAWTPDELPGAHPAKPARKPLFQASPPAMLPRELGSFEDGLLGLPAADETDVNGFWADSPSPLGRVGDLA